MPDGADLAFLKDGEGLLKNGRVFPVMDRKYSALGLGDRRGERLVFRGVERQWFFAEDVAVVREAFQREFRMERRRRADIDKIELLCAEKLIDGAIGAQAGFQRFGRLLALGRGIHDGDNFY